MPTPPLTRDRQTTLSNGITQRKNGSKRPDDPIPYKSGDFEEDVRDLLEKIFPFSIVSGLRLFSPTNRIISGALCSGLRS